MTAMPPPNIMIATLESQVRNLTEVVNTLIDVVVAKDAAP
jgi:hypothetical protein